MTLTQYWIVGLVVISTVMMLSEKGDHKLRKAWSEIQTPGVRVGVFTMWWATAVIGALLWPVLVALFVVVFFRSLK